MALDLELQDNNSHFLVCVDCDRDFIFFQHSQNRRACLILLRPSEKWEGGGVIRLYYLLSDIGGGSVRLENSYLRV